MFHTTTTPTRFDLYSRWTHTDTDNPNQSRTAVCTNPASSVDSGTYGSSLRP